MRLIPRPARRARLSPLLRAFVLLVVVFVAGTIGYRIIGGPAYTWLDAMYMTTITLTTVGYREAINIENSSSGQIFTLVLLLVGVGSFLYFFSNLTAFMVEGTMDKVFWRRRMNRKLNHLKDHFIVCGGGATGQYVVRELVATGRDFVLIEKDPERVQSLYDEIGHEFLAVVGDATEDEVLDKAGIERARGLVSCISSDKDNLVVAFLARDRRSDLRIVSRCSDDKDQPKIVKAGANSTVSPSHIGGLRLVSELVRPSAVSFLDNMLRDREANLRVEEVPIAKGSSLDGTTIAAFRKQVGIDMLILAVHMPDGKWRYNPDGNQQLTSGMRFVFIGNPEARERVERAAS